MAGPHHPHGRRRAVLLVVGVEDEQHVDGPGDDRVDLVLLCRHPEGEPHEVLDVPEGVVGVEEGLPDRLLVGVGGDRRHLRQQPYGRDLHVLPVERVEAVLVERRQGRDGRGEHGHRVGVAREPVEEPPQALVQQGVPTHVVSEGGQLRGGGQLAVDQQVGDLEEGGALGELLDGVTAVAQDPGVTVDVGDGRGAGGRVDETRVQRHLPGRGEQCRDVEAGGALGRSGHRQRKGAAGVGQGEVGHEGPPALCRRCLPLLPSLSRGGPTKAAVSRVGPTAGASPGRTVGLHDRLGTFGRTLRRLGCMLNTRLVAGATVLGLVGSGLLAAGATSAVAAPTSCEVFFDIDKDKHDDLVVGTPGEDVGEGRRRRHRDRRLRRRRGHVRPVRRSVDLRGRPRVHLAERGPVRSSRPHGRPQRRRVRRPRDRRAGQEPPALVRSTWSTANSPARAASSATRSRCCGRAPTASVARRRPATASARPSP